MFSKHVRFANPSVFTGKFTRAGDLVFGSADNAVGLLDQPDGNGFMLISDAIGDVGTEWRLPTIQEPPAVGDYFVPPHVSRTASIPALNIAYASPIWIPHQITVDRIGCEVTTLDATGVVRLGIYAHDFTTGRPGALVVDAGTVSGAAAAVVEATINQVLAAGLYYLVAVAQTSVATLQVRRVASVAYGIPHASTATVYGATVPSVYFQSGVSGALPNTFVPSATLVTNGTLVFLRRSA